MRLKCWPNWLWSEKPARGDLRQEQVRPCLREMLGPLDAAGEQKAHAAGAFRSPGRLIGWPRPSGRADPNRSEGLLRLGGVARGEGGLEFPERSAVALGPPGGAPQRGPVEVATCCHRGVADALSSQCCGARFTDGRTGLSSPERRDKQHRNKHQIEVELRHRGDNVLHIDFKRLGVSGRMGPACRRATPAWCLVSRASQHGPESLMVSGAPTILLPRGEPGLEARPRRTAARGRGRRSGLRRRRDPSDNHPAQGEC
jgi:hypothetical protein